MFPFFLPPLKARLCPTPEAEFDVVSDVDSFNVFSDYKNIKRLEKVESLNDYAGVILKNNGDYSLISPLFGKDGFGRFFTINTFSKERKALLVVNSFMKADTVIKAMEVATKEGKKLLKHDPSFALLGDLASYTQEVDTKLKERKDYKGIKPLGTILTCAADIGVIDDKSFNLFIESARAISGYYQEKKESKKGALSSIGSFFFKNYMNHDSFDYMSFISSYELITAPGITFINFIKDMRSLDYNVILESIAKAIEDDEEASVEGIQ
jgi:hypothetical protein